MTTWTDQSDYDTSRASHELDLCDPIDWLQAESLEARYQTRRDFSAARLTASRWEPAPMHVHDAPAGDCSCDVDDRAGGYDPIRTPYLDEIALRRPWFRS